MTFNYCDFSTPDFAGTNNCGYLTIIIIIIIINSYVMKFIIAILISITNSQLIVPIIKSHLKVLEL